jgi:hypothetical protein
VPPASLTKIMTALVAADHADLNEMVRIVNDSFLRDRPRAGIGRDTLSMQSLYGLLLASGYDAAIRSRARGRHGSCLVRLMNEKAAARADRHISRTRTADDRALHSLCRDAGTGAAGGTSPRSCEHARTSRRGTSQRSRT